MKINKLNLILSISIATLLVACVGSSDSSTSAPQWQQVGPQLNYKNVSFNSLAVNNSGMLYVAGSVDANNPAVFNLLGNNIWQLTGGYYVSPNPYSYSERVNSVSLNQTNNTLYAAVNILGGANGSEVFANNGSNGTWVQINNESEMPDYGTINTMAVNSSTGTLYAATSGYLVDSNTYFGDVYSNTGANGSWQAVGGGSTPDSGPINAIAVATNSAIYIGTGGNNPTVNSTTFGDVYSSTSGGNWQQVGGGAMPDSGAVTALQESSSGATYAGTSNGNVYVSNGSAWSSLGGSLPDNSSVTAMTIASSNGNLYVATANGDVYVNTGSAWSQVASATPDGFAISGIASYQNTIYITTIVGNVYSFAI